jgi:hypothetical protein
MLHGLALKLYLFSQPCNLTCHGMWPSFFMASVAFTISLVERMDPLISRLYRKRSLARMTSTMLDTSSISFVTLVGSQVGLGLLGRQDALLSGQ